jgi:hypothetical protein
LLLCFEAAPRLYEVDNEQKDSVVVVVAGLPWNLSHIHALIDAEIKPELREEVRVLGEGVAEEEADCPRLLPDLVEFEIDCLSQLFYLRSHNLQLDHFIHLLIRKRIVLVRRLHIQAKHPIHVLIILILFE